MSWPLASQFSAMLQNPKVAFRDSALQALRFEKAAMGQPRPWAGAFAVVYKGIDPQGGPRAVRVFTTESPERHERYDAISAYLRGRQLKCLVDFEYRDRSIRSAGDGKWYPLILMQWVEGETLFDWVRGRALAADRPGLERLAQKWLALVKELADAQVAHGDLQHANVLVTPQGELKLVDYDGMCVPALIGRRNLEVGVEPYQHPDRKESTLLGPGLDRFSALLIYVALRALAAVPPLWQAYVESAGHDKILFRRDDLAAPAASLLCGDMLSSPDRDVRDLTQRLIDAYGGPMDQVPTLAELTDSDARIEQLLQRRQWTAAVKLLNRRRRPRDLPAEMQPLIEEAYKHVLRQKAWEKFRAIPHRLSQDSDRLLVEAWNEALFGGLEAAEHERPRVVAAQQRLEVCQRLEELLGQTAGVVSVDGEQTLAELAPQLPADYRHGALPRLALARQRVAAAAHLQAALEGGGSEAAIAAAWQEVVQAQGERLFDATVRARVELAEERVPLVAALREISTRLPPDQLDRRILAAWRPAVLAGCAEAQGWAGLYETAVRRKELLGRLHAAVEDRDSPAIVAAVDDPCLAGYPMSTAWTAVIKSARELAGRTDVLVAALGGRQREKFAKLFDARLVRQYGQRFAPFQNLLADWTASQILPLEQIGLAPAVGRASLVAAAEPPGAYRVRWTWPPARFADQCLLAVCRQEPAPGVEPTELDPLSRMLMDRASWEGAGGSRLLEPQPDWAAAYVAVWARVDLGFRAFYSDPLILGRLPARSRRLWQRLGTWWRPKSSGPAAGSGGVRAIVSPAGDEDRPHE